MQRVVVLTCLFAAVLASPFEPPALRELRRNPLFPNGRIVGGDDTDIRDVPYQVAMEYFGSHFCGGTLISQSHVLTAAHCIIAPAESIQVRVGSSQRGNGGVLHSLYTHYSHPDYDVKTLDNDVAVLQLAGKVDLTSSVKVAPIIEAEPAADTYLRVSGWGATKEDGAPSPTLKSVYIPVISRKRCQELYSMFKINITERMLCAYMEGKDSCQGDSGGPAVVNGKVAGIVSWGVGCARPNYPGVYTNVAESDIRAFIRHYAKV